MSPLFTTTDVGVPSEVGVPTVTGVPFFSIHAVVEHSADDTGGKFAAPIVVVHLESPISLRI